MPITSDIYKQIGRAAAGAVSVVAAYDRANGGVVALTVSSFVTLSFEPPLVMFAIQRNADSYASMMTSKAFGVSLLSEEQVGIAQLCATKGLEKSKKAPIEQSATLQVPLVPGALAQIECVTNQIFISGDHAIIVGLVEGAQTRDAQPLLYFARQYGAFAPLTRA
jgi:flavin reductase (DIM6/NTAB) family NADH-FMN oxidoreductase RutF